MCVDYGIMNGWMDGMIIRYGMAIYMNGLLLHWLDWVWFRWSSDDVLLLGWHGVMAWYIIGSCMVRQ